MQSRRELHEDEDKEQQQQQQRYDSSSSMSFVQRMSKKPKPTDLQNDFHDQRPKTHDLHHEITSMQTHIPGKHEQEMFLLSSEFDFIWV